ncbi:MULTISPECIES: hypothetical protein [Shinella]|uniref:Uncharacterized protein n=1 Tax=Shinella lacus TaxID=2654216 RepID=A0ABT1R430_9HYPH|nr:hypothetical protein [Shinella lacus]MCQ4629925.1 hypothetical protein [Shinella lacus]
MTHHIDNRQFSPRQTRNVLDVIEHCRKNGLDKAEERKLLLLFGRFASRHELQMNIKRQPTNVR